MSHRYDPFVPGPVPITVRTEELVEAARGGRTLPVEVWRPAVDEAVPLVLFSHTSGGHRRQAAALCAHLASHGYVAAAPDHVGSTAADREQRAAQPEPLTIAKQDELVASWIADRPRDLAFVAERLTGDDARISAERLGVVGWSFGGWAALAWPETDKRVGAVVAMAPAGSLNPLPGIIRAPLTFAWGRDVPTLFLAAERDQFIPVTHVVELYERAPVTKRMVTLRGAYHEHFGDEIPVVAGSCPPEQAHLFARGLTVAHMDAHLKADDRALSFWSGDVLSELATRGVDAIARRNS